MTKTATNQNRPAHLMPLKSVNTFSATGSQQTVPAYQLAGYTAYNGANDMYRLKPVVDTTRPVPAALAYAVYDPSGDFPTADRMRPGASAHEAFPSRMGNALHYRDGRVEALA